MFALDGLQSNFFVFGVRK